MTQPGLVSLLVLAYNSGELLADCLQAAVGQREATVEVLCLDNASADSSVAVARSIDGVTVLTNATNVGYAAGMNQLLTHSRGEAVVFLNADCVVDAHFAAHALRLLHEHPELGVLGATVSRADGSDDGAVLCMTDTMRVRLCGRPPPGDRWPTFKPNGSCPVVRRTLLDALRTAFGVDAFDPVFDTYGEDVDFAFRAHSLGAGIICTDSLRATHLRSHASAVSVLDKRGRMRINVVAARHINARRHLPWRRLCVVVPILVAQDVALVLRQLLVADVGVVRDVVGAWRRAAAARCWSWRRRYATAQHYARELMTPPSPARPPDDR